MTTSIRKLIVEVVDARNLSPKDGHGTSSPYVVVDYYGQRKRTKTSVRDLNPTWNEVLEFNVGPPSSVFGDVLELDINHDRNYGATRRSNFLGRIRLSSTQFVKKGEEALIYFALEKRSLFNWIQGEIGLKIYYLDEVTPPPSPPPSPSPRPPDTNAAEPLLPTAETSELKQPATDEKRDVISATTLPEPEKEQLPPSFESNSSTETMSKPDPPEENVEALKPAADDHNHNHVEVMTASVSKSEPAEINFAPKQIKKPLPTVNYSLESTESLMIERSTFDLVEKMHYLFVRIVKARSLPTNGSPIVKIDAFGQCIRSKPATKTNTFEWDQTFAFGRDAPDSPSIMEISVWDPTTKDLVSDVDRHNFLGGLCFEVSEILLRDPPDSPLAPQWYKLEKDDNFGGYLMLATWIGTQADEAFQEAWKTDSTGNNINSQAKAYQSPKLWYLRATVLEAQDIFPLTSVKEASFQIKAQLGFQVSKTKVSVTRNGAPAWNEDLLFIAAEPLSNDHLIFTLENRQPKAAVTLGVVRVPITDIERRVDDRTVTTRWFTLNDPDGEKTQKSVYKGRIQLRLCYDGGYHVMDEAAHVCSDYRPTARQLWKPPVGSIELGVIGCRNLLPMKMLNGKGLTDAYCVVKYGSKWVRTRTVCNNLDPKWNEQYTWKVYDPCTVLTIGVFDSSEVLETNDVVSPSPPRPDCRIGKVRIRISTLQTGKVYKNLYPLLVLTSAGTKKMGEVEIAVRFIAETTTLDFVNVYSQPLLPLMHHVKPLGTQQQVILRNTAVKMVAGHLSKAEPPLRKEIVMFMLDVDSQSFSMRKVRANWYRIINVVAGVIDIVKWVENTRTWKNPTSTILVHALLVMLVWFPDLIVPTLSFYVFVIGAWNYRFRSRDPLPHFDSKISLADVVEKDELDEEFDSVPSSRSPEIVRMRYEKLRAVGARVQTVLGDLATQGERVQALVTWRDPRATCMFTVICFMVAMILYIVPSKMVAVAFGFYYLRHPICRDRQPAPVINFLRRLPSLSDRIM